MKMKSTFTSAGGYYYEGGYKYHHSEGCVERREDGKCYTHFVANLGNLKQEISEADYNKYVADLRSKDGKVTTHWSGVKLKLFEETRDVEVYSWELEKAS